MKKLFSVLLFFCLIAVIGASLYSCSQTTTGITVQLLSAPSSLSLTRTDSSQLSEVGLSCGCNFDSLVATGYVGATDVIHFSFKDAITANPTVHGISATIFPSNLKSPGSDSAWIALFYREQDGSGALL